MTSQNIAGYREIARWKQGAVEYVALVRSTDDKFVAAFVIDGQAGNSPVLELALQTYSSDVEAKRAVDEVLHAYFGKSSA